MAGRHPTFPRLDFSSFFKSGEQQAIITLKPAGQSNRERLPLAGQLGLTASAVCVPVQIHSNIIRTARQPGEFAETDGLVTGDHHLVLSLQVADCIPLFIADIGAGLIGLIHIGWRGAATGIVANAVNIFVTNGGRPGDIQALIGPCIRQESFEVGPEVAGQFKPQFCRPGRRDRSYLDLPGVCADQLLDAGLPAAKIDDCGLDTYTDDQRFHSYRREGQAAGRQFAFFNWR